MSLKTYTSFALGLVLVVVCSTAIGQQDPPSGQDKVPILVKLEPSTPIKIEMPAGSQPAWWTYVVAPFVSGLLAFGGVFAGLRYSQKTTAQNITAALKANQATNWQKANEKELESLEARLSGFYGPLMTRLQADHLLAQDLRNRQTDKEYRLLKYLFNEKWREGLTEGDRKLVATICEHAGKLEEMIINFGSVDPLLIPYLSRAVAHFRILQLAHNRMLGTEFHPFERYVYPRALDKVLVLEIKRLTARMEKLRKHATEQLNPISPLVIPNEDQFRLAEWPDPDGRILKSERWLV